jgi:tetratricopeptide (TPR) repeat protein
MMERSPYPAIEPPDTHFLDAAVGWLMLGNPGEARAEYDQLSPECRQHPAAISVHWRILAAEKKWQEAVAVGEAQVTAAPEEALGYINRSFALHELGQTAYALRLLLPAAAQFPKEWVIPYNLACYYCRMKDLESARLWLRRCFAIDLPAEEQARRQQAAQEDPDLADLRDQMKDGKG